MSTREILESLRARCHICNSALKLDEMGCPKCPSCDKKFLENSDYEASADWSLERIDNYSDEIWILDGKLIDHLKGDKRMGKCEKCGADNGFGTYCDSEECGCGALKHWSCKDCGHVTHYFHATKKGKEVLRVLLKGEQEE